MVVRLRMGRSIRGALSYNERKVSQGKAELLLAVGFSCDIAKLGFSKKLNRFQSLTERNEKVRTNTLHLSINFPPEEHLSENTMRTIAMEYMEQIGFGGQPFLVYKHKDAAHPHIHIVTTNVQADATPISFHYLARDKSEPARKAIEREYRLIPADGRNQAIALAKGEDSSSILVAEHGKSATKHLITNKVGEVIRSYKFSSLEEFNLILRGFSIVADPGLPGTKRHNKGGLVYSLLDGKGQKAGVPIKASDIYGEPPPTLKSLQRRFAANAVKKASLQIQVKSTIDSILNQSRTMKELTDGLKGKRIRMHLEKDSLGIIRQLHFLDHRTKAAFSHQDLQLSFNDIYRLQAEAPKRPSQSTRKTIPNSSQNTNNNPEPNTGTDKPSTSIGIIHAMLQSGEGAPGQAGDPPKKKKRKKRRPLF